MKSSKSYGGYLPLELNFAYNGHYYKDSLKLHSGRNSLEILITERNIKRIFIPRFGCDVILEPLLKHLVEIELYNINENLEPILNQNFDSSNDYLLYINYFGMKGDFTDILANTYPNLIIDNSQAFYKKNKSCDYFNSARKFFGVPDGSYLVTDKPIKNPPRLSNKSYSYANYLLAQHDCDIETGYEQFKKSEIENFSNKPVQLMSKFSSTLLEKIDYELVKKARIANYELFNLHLQGMNLFKVEKSADDVPISYPFLTDLHVTLRKELIQNKIYTPQYWLSNCGTIEKDSSEEKLKNLIHLPIDQRYKELDVAKIIDVITDLTKR